MIHPVLPVEQIVQPIDILSGLGAAERPLLSACIALFEDSTLARGLSQLYGQVKGGAEAWLGQAGEVHEIENMAASVQRRIDFWRDGDWSDDDLRLIAWIYLREAFALPERLCLSERSAARICDDLAAAAIALGAPLSKTPAATPDDPSQGVVNLARVVQPVLQELLATALGEGPGQLDAAAQKSLLAEARAGLGRMDEADRNRLLKAAKVQDLNDVAVRNILLTSGGLVAFSGGVEVAGFSAYILAAQASAFIPLVSGPGWVSFVSVLSNPITVVGMSALALWWFVTEADRQVRVAVGLRVLALLAAGGLSAGRNDVLRALESFRRIEQLKPIGDLSDDACRRYREDWCALQEAERHFAERKPATPKTEPLDPRMIEWLERPAVEAAGPLGRLAEVLFPGAREKANAAAISVLTLGDIVYSAAMIDPSVIEAADFSYSEEIDNLVAFSDLASKILELNPIQASGAINRLEGYVAEQVVAKLVAQGHQVVVFPKTSNQEGWDLLVDGQEFQVKCLQRLDDLTEHFSKFEYPVLANAELAEAVAVQAPAWADKVFSWRGTAMISLRKLRLTRLLRGMP